MINSNTRPETFVIEHNGSRINYNIVEVKNDEGVISYNYESDKHPSKDSVELDRYLTKLTTVTVAEAIAKMTVGVNGKVFGANEVARMNMLSAVVSAEFMNATETVWKLEDDTTVVVTLLELKEAVALALQKFGALKGIV